MIRRFKHIFAACLFAAAAASAAPAASASAAFPERPITLVVPYAPGGSADALARVLAVRIGARLGTSVIVDNKPGASGTIGAGFVAKATPDGYTVLYDATPYSINPHLFPRLPYTAKALQPLTLVSLAPNIVIVGEASPFRTIKDLVDKAKAQPGKLNFASGGSGTVQRLAAELLRQRLGLEMVHVGYKSGGPAIVDVMGGQVDFMFSTIAASSPLVASGKLRALAISSPKRSARLPDVPTVGETVVPGYEAYEWNGIFVPAGTPPAVAEKLQQTIVDVLGEDDTRKRFVDVGVQPVGSTPAEFTVFLKKEDEKWAEVIRKGHIKLD
ncbi:MULTISPECIES: tripartite tricarboxylate transporter substrate binding protein [unclassified Variovorax]|uniref:tripartite tricarboxylate transporter substrate binding protein n=1 Tax=unclassified Variovorax TaxID=663243 RepID=UPI0008C04CF5|nr:MULTISPECIES: tripartite tricarboxylate transporter substrate binding protein [unclassified Variovorax]SEK08361.1 Tripartite-type tricarboxylate transporter, receptor component TctC [Variovorax sp. OK202]SFD55518.1 Tripartite-type tricarboxylate transporter, receptor component TctC [Variovorax sp. OK212]